MGDRKVPWLVRQLRAIGIEAGEATIRGYLLGWSQHPNLENVWAMSLIFGVELEELIEPLLEDQGVSVEDVRQRLPTRGMRIAEVANALEEALTPMLIGGGGFDALYMRLTKNQRGRFLQSLMKILSEPGEDTQEGDTPIKIEGR